MAAAVWTNENRARYDRCKLRYPSDLTDVEWAHVAPVILPARRGGNLRHVDERELVKGLMYVLSTGCQWRAIPKDLPARSTLYDYFDLWSYDGTLDRLHEALYVKCREQAGRDAGPTATILNSHLPSADRTLRAPPARPPESSPFRRPPHVQFERETAAMRTAFDRRATGSDTEHLQRRMAGS